MKLKKMKNNFIIREIQKWQNKQRPNTLRQRKTANELAQKKKKCRDVLLLKWNK